MQSSGLGNAVNPLTSLVVPFRLPVLVLVSGRGWRTPDEPQHRLMGEHLEAFLQASGVPWLTCPSDVQSLGGLIEDAVERAREAEGPVAVVVPRGTFSRHVMPPPPAPGRPTRGEVLRALVPRLRDRAVVSTTGFTSRDLHALADRDRNFYMQGSMGHAAGIGLALAQLGHRVVVLDGDGAALMHLGAMAMIGRHPGIHLCHIILDNGVHESTGNQPVSPAPVDFAAVARAVGYRHAGRCDSTTELDRELDAALGPEGPSCLVAQVRVEDGAAPASRITDTLGHHELARRFRDSLGVMVDSRKKPVP
jgi:phosphonopyruvate decarboxylase